MQRIDYRTLRSLPLILVLLISGFAFAVPMCTPPVLPVEKALTVEEAVAIALQYNQAVTIDAQNVQIAQNLVDAARALGLPTVSVGASANYVADPTTITVGETSFAPEKLSSSAQAVISQPVWPSSRWRAPVDSAKANVGINQESLARTRQQVVFQTRQAFYLYLGAQEFLQASQFTVQVNETSLKLAEATFNAGTAPKLDVIQAEANLADAQVSLDRARNALEVTRAALATQLGYPAGTPITIAPMGELPVAPEKVEPLVMDALKIRPELVQINYRRAQVLANMDIIRLQQRPLIDAQASYNQTVLGGSIFGTDGAALAATFAFNLYNGGKTKAELAAAEVQLAQLDSTTQQVSIGITFEVRQAWLNLQSSLRVLVSAEQQRVAAEEALRISELRYAQGEGILLEVQQAQLRSTQALNTLVQARYQAQVAAAQLDYAIGIPVESMMARTANTTKLPS